ncbi:MAG: ATP-dependent DNA helicase RecQ [Gemmatimonadales bacterium]|nr:ATP-dependent DNA helicase RecQ [Gemmatimonadales bacterium]
MPDPMEQARHALRHHFGYGDFRPAQSRVLRSVLGGRDTLAVLPTGGGKSVCFQVPALVLGGLTVVVSPLISLMQDQVAAAVARGIPAACLTSGLSDAERVRVGDSLRQGQLRLLYVSPERLERLAPQLQRAGIRPTLLAVDEAHCIVEWGHDFRPSYRTLKRARYRLGKPPAVALTGSATPEVRNDIARALGFAPGRYAVHLGSFDRSNLWFGVVQVPDERARLGALLQLLGGEDRMAIVYGPTRGVTEALARALVNAGHRAAPYHAGLTRARRSETLDAFLEDRLDVVVATCAFGMGIDKPNVRLVVHWTLPPTPESYYQEAGRAGRDGELARCVLLWRPGDAELHRRQLEVTFPPVRTLERAWSSAAGAACLPRNLQESAERLRRELRPEQGPVDWGPVRHRRRRAESRITAMDSYARRASCRRRALVGYFGEALDRCAGCDRCTAQVSPPPRLPEVADRLRRLRAALGWRRGAWGGALLEPEVLLRLARRPPADAGALADVPGVGTVLAERVGGTILEALGKSSCRCVAEPSSPARLALEAWRRQVAFGMGVPPYAVLRDGVLRAIATADITTREQLARIPGLGPRAYAKFADDILRIVAGPPPQAAAVRLRGPARIVTDRLCPPPPGALGS